MRRFRSECTIRQEAPRSRPYGWRRDVPPAPAHPCGFVQRRPAPRRPACPAPGSARVSRAAHMLRNACHRFERRPRPYTPTPYMYTMRDLGLGCKSSARGRRDVLGFAALGLEAVADAAHGFEKDRIRRIIGDMAAQTHDEIVDGTRGCVLAHAPHLFQQLFAWNVAPLVPYQIAQQLGFHDGEANAAAALFVVGVRDAQLERGEVDGASGKGVGLFGLA